MLVVLPRGWVCGGAQGGAGGGEGSGGGRGREAGGGASLVSKPFFIQKEFSNFDPIFKMGVQWEVSGRSKISVKTKVM
jgi:hypothetical protein